MQAYLFARIQTKNENVQTGFSRAISSKSRSHAFVPDKMLELEIDRNCLNYNENLKLMPFGKSFHLMPLGKNAIWEVTQNITRL